MLFIVENGFGVIDRVEEDGFIYDVLWIEYLKLYIEVLEKVVMYDGVDLMGYMLWGIIDIVFFIIGEMKKWYGMIYVDCDNEGNGLMKCYKKDFFNWYKYVIEINGEEL